MTKPKPASPAAAGNPSANKGTASLSTKRRSSRVAIDMPVEIFGQSANGKVFREETRTTTVNAHGALLVLGSAVQIKPSVLLINKTTRIEVQCRVISLKETEKGKVELGVEFVIPQPRFWGISFPPEDWNNADRKKPVSQTK
ncbi:MAG: hypothetical protein LAO19_07140 [Acidobacteriia bacterium]|nr:hypothetical protein [Terriglobia bacterium]